VPRYQSVDELQNALASGTFSHTDAPKKAAGRALGTLIELITFYMIRDWGLEPNLAIERGLPEYGNRYIKHNVEFTLHVVSDSITAAVPARSGSLTTRRLIAALPEGTFTGAVARSTNALKRGDVVRHSCTVADEPGRFWNAYMLGDDQFTVSCLIEEPFAMLECKRVGVEEGQRKGPQTIEKAKQGAYVARVVSGLQRIPRRDGTVAALVEEADGSLVTHHDYYQFIRDAIDNRDGRALANVVLTVGVVSNHGNWFTAQTANKEMLVLAQSYDWLIFLTDDALGEFIRTVLQGSAPEFAATRAAFSASFGRTSGTTTFTKVTIDAAADKELTDYFAATRPWAAWFNVISPVAGSVNELQADLIELAEIRKDVTTA